MSEIFTANWMDKKIIDGIVHGFGKGAMVLGNFLRTKIDLPVINGGGDGLSAGTRQVGFSLKSTQTGQVQMYLLLTMIMVVIVGVLFIVIF